MAKEKTKFSLKNFEDEVKKMEIMGCQDNRNQKDWEDDVNDPLEKAMVIKDKPSYGNQNKEFCRVSQNRRGKKFNRNPRKWNGRSSYVADTSSDVGSSASSYVTCWSGFSNNRVRRNRSFGSKCSSVYSDATIGYESDSSNITSVSRSKSLNSGIELSPSSLSKYLSEFEGFQATLLQLLDKFGLNHNIVKKISLKNDHTFVVEQECISLRPKLKVCSSYLSEGCYQRDNCLNIHLCEDYILGHCRDRDCCFGHYWLTNHNKRIFNYYHINFLPIKKIYVLFKNYLLPRATTKDLKVCEFYNEGKCENKNCPFLHLCLKFLGNQCVSAEQCSLNHKVISNDVKFILQSHGISLNETPKDILLSIVKFSSIQKSIENLNLSPSASDPNSKNVPEGSNKDKKDEKDLPSSSSASKIEQPVEEPLPVKTLWSYELNGESTIEEICYNSVDNLCPFEDTGCWRLHCPNHFHWQIKAMLEKKFTWINLTEVQSCALERAFCDPSITKVDLPLFEPSVSQSFDKRLIVILKGKKSKWEANFDEMKINLGGQDTGLELRRLCTEITKNELPEPCKFKWYFSDIDGNWIEYGNIDSTGDENLKCNLSSKDIENHFQTRSLSPLPFFSQSYTYILDTQNMIQMNLDTNSSRKIRRRPIPHLKNEDQDKTNNDVPLNWDPMQPEERCRRVVLSPSSEEYKKIEKLVQSTSNSNGQIIIKIERVQNQYVYKMFQIKEQEMKVTYKNESVVDVRQLFHGTTSNNVAKICEENFDWRLHGSSSGHSYGKGTYFSTLSSYSLGYARPDANGHTFLFVAKVAVGTITSGNSGMARPPVNLKYNLPYDSTVDNVANPSIIVKYDKQEYYPEYIVTLG